MKDAIVKMLEGSHGRIRLDVGCGFNRQKGFVGMDKRDLPTVDIVHDAEVFPYPLRDGACEMIVMSHVIEHLKPWLTLEVFNELWRIIADEGVLMISAPYATSFGMFQDPTHCNFVNEATFFYFDPKHPSGLWNIYRPSPWEITNLVWDYTGNIECALKKRSNHEDYHGKPQRQAGKRVSKSTSGVRRRSA